MSGKSTLTPTKAERYIGQLPLAVGPIAYGFWRFSGSSIAVARNKVETALSLGMNLFDHADIYGVDGDGAFGDAEALFGEVLKEAPQIRDQALIATKGGIVLGRPYDSSEGYLTEAVERSLRRLNIESIDLYQIHRPDFLTHPAQLADTLEGLRASGKIKEVGVSNFTVAQTRALQAHLSFPLVTSQPEWSCWSHQALRDGTLDYCMEATVTPLGWSPLGGGKLAASAEQVSALLSDGQLNEDQARRLSSILVVLDRIALEREVSRAAIAIAWTMAHPAGVIPIIGTQNLERMADCAQAADVIFTREEWNEVLIAAQGYPLP